MSTPAGPPKVPLCPRCGAFYEKAAIGPDRTRRITAADAKRLFGLPEQGSADAAAPAEEAAE